MASREAGYSGWQIGMHWLIVAMVAVQLLIAENMTEMVDAAEEGEKVSGGVSALGNLHFWLGIAILVLMLVRLGMRITLGAPAHSGDSSPIMNIAAAAMHGALYLVLIAVPISGLIAYYGIADVGDIHALSKPILIVLVLLHAGAALYNQFVRKDGTLMRMIKPSV